MRLLIDITSHGWGHLAQTAPIVAALRRSVPNFSCIVRSALPEAAIVKKLGPIEGYLQSDSDFGVVMQNALVVDASASFERYQSIHKTFKHRVTKLASFILEQQCDGVLSNVGYLALSAGKAAGVVTAAVSSLNWGDLFRAYCSQYPGAPSILSEIEAAYQSANLFLRLSPGMPMESITTAKILRPIAKVGHANRGELTAALGIPTDRIIVLLAFGGMLPAVERAHLLSLGRQFELLGPPAWHHLGVRPADNLPIEFSDVLASCDAVISKPGYGIVAELACLGKPAIMLSRSDWPEEDYLVEWLSRHVSVELVESLSGISPDHINAVVNSTYQHIPVNAGGEDVVASSIVALVESHH